MIIGDFLQSVTFYKLDNWQIDKKYTRTEWSSTIESLVNIGVTLECLGCGDLRANWKHDTSKKSPKVQNANRLRYHPMMKASAPRCPDFPLVKYKVV